MPEKRCRSSSMQVLTSLLPYATGQDIPLPGGLKHGVSFKSLVESADPEQAHQPYVVIETTFDKGITRGWALRTPRYKYVLYDKGNYREQLYNMEDDRGEDA